MKKNKFTNPKTVGSITYYLTNNFQDQLSKSDINEIFAFLLGLNYHQVLTMGDLELNDKQLKQLQKILIKVVQGVPLAYLLGHKFFFNHDYLVDRGVLVPREDSELLIEEAFAFLETNYPEQGVRVVDLGTGTGVLGLTIANLRKTKDEYILTDISSKALKNTQKNLTHLNLDSKKIKIKKANFLDLFTTVLPANVIISNPPYIAHNDVQLSASVNRYEPHKALFAKNQGMDFYQKMAQNFLAVVDTNRPFLIIMEFGFNQKEAIEELFKNLASNYKIEFLKDKKGN